jgi:heme/copper-type cytochrome/quinol oxidase subunit 2
MLCESFGFWLVSTRVTRTLVCVLAAVALSSTVAMPSLAAVEDQIEVTVSRVGFRPAVLKFRKGETVRLALRSADDEHCFAIDALRIEKRVQPGRTTMVDVTPDKAGSLAFYCCLEPNDQRQRGQIVVSD